MSDIRSVASSDNSSPSPSEGEDKTRKRSREDKFAKLASHLDSNGESDDEIDKWKQILADKTKELQEEQQTNKKVRNVTVQYRAGQFLR